MPVSLRKHLRGARILPVCAAALLSLATASAAQEAAPVPGPSGQANVVPVSAPATTQSGTEAPATIPTGTATSAPDAVAPAQLVTTPTASLPQKPSKDLGSMSIEELMEIEVQTVVSASRYRQKISEAPSSISIITAEDIRKFGYRTLADILRSVRGFYTTYDRNYQYLGVRGFGRLGDYNTRVLLLVDGHRINDVIYDSAPIGTEFILDVDLIERVEVTRGPGSSLYGSNAFFGVVNIITRGAREVGGGEVSAEASSYSSYKGRLSYGMQGKPDGGLLASLTGASSDGDRLYFREFDPRYPLADPRARNNGFADNGDYDRFRSGYAKYEEKGFRLTSAYIERTKGIPTASFGTDFNDTRNRTVDGHGYVDLQYSARSSGGDEYSARVYYDRSWYDGRYLYAGTMNKDLADGAWYGGEARITTRVLNIHHIIAGVEYEIRGRQDQWNGDVGPTTALFLDDRRRSRASGAYVQDEVTVSPIFLLYAGIRYDEVSTFGSEANPRLSAVINPIENGTIKLLYGRAFRAPTVYELYYQSPPSIVSNPLLRPETIETYELVYEHDFGKGLRAVASRYSYGIRNLITETRNPIAGTTSFQNVEKAEATGTELEVRKTWPNGADGSVSYAYQKAENPNTGERLTNSPIHLARLNVSVPLISERLWASVAEQYTGSRTTLSGGTARAYAVTDLTLLARSRARAWEASLSVYNLLDKRYADPASVALFPLDVVQQDGRTVRIKLTYAF